MATAEFIFSIAVASMRHWPDLVMLSSLEDTLWIA